MDTFYNKKNYYIIYFDKKYNIAMRTYSIFGMSTVLLLEQLTWKYLITYVSSASNITKVDTTSVTIKTITTKAL